MQNLCLFNLSVPNLNSWFSLIVPSCSNMEYGLFQIHETMNVLFSKPLFCLKAEHLYDFLFCVLLKQEIKYVKITSPAQFGKHIIVRGMKNLCTSFIQFIKFFSKSKYLRIYSFYSYKFVALLTKNCISYLFQSLTSFMDLYKY